ncbi:hypothetical protein ABE444_03670 [Brevundimonas pondensis]|uniref:hypothetical protein n=1 Tax=Brevundimonas pondensis TaxID=2774189 RepID=UPI00320B82F5
MIAVDPDWWHHLTPTVMHPHRLAVDAALNRFAASAYGKMWFESALTPHGLIRVSPGQIIPVLHIAMLGDRGPIILPFRKVRPGHRFVGTGEMGSGRPLAPDELALSPEIRFELVTDPAMIAAVRSLDLERSFVGVAQPSQIFSTPARHLLRPELRPSGSFVLYQHIFGHQSSYPDDGWFYVGITTRRWQSRWAEHWRAIKADSPLRFHQRYREERAAGLISYVHHKVMAVTDEIESLFEAERRLIAGHWDDTRRLNMSAGSLAGRRSSKSKAAQSSDVELSVPRTVRHPRLSPDQVRAIRAMGGIAATVEIVRRVEGTSRRQVTDVVARRTYHRID